MKINKPKYTVIVKNNGKVIWHSASFEGDSLLSEINKFQEGTYSMWINGNPLISDCPIHNSIPTKDYEVSPETQTETVKSFKENWEGKLFHHKSDTSYLQIKSYWKENDCKVYLEQAQAFIQSMTVNWSDRTNAQFYLVFEKNHNLNIMFELDGFGAIKGFSNSCHFDSQDWRYKK